MRIFEEFPSETSVCPICGLASKGQCVLIGVDGTAEGYNVQAQPFHLSCIELTYFKKDKLIAMKWKK